MRPAWMIRLGLFMYDHLARREVLPGSRTVDLRQHPAGAAAQAAVQARLRLFRRLGRRCAAGGAQRARRARARRRGPDAHALHRRAARRRRLDRHARRRRRRHAHRARARRGQRRRPWAESFLRGVAQAGAGRSAGHPAACGWSRAATSWSSGCFEHDHAYIFQNPDKRIIFAIPYQDDFTLIGTTDVELQGRRPRRRARSDEEIAYLCEQASRYFEKPVRAGRRGVDLLRRAAAARRCVGRPVGRHARLPARSQHRRGAAAVGVGRQDHHLPQAGRGRGRRGRPHARRAPRTAWTDGAFLAGGDLSAWIGAARAGARPDDEFERFVARRAGAASLAATRALARRLARAYGGRIAEVLGDAAVDGRPGRRGRARACTSANCATCRTRNGRTSGDDVLWRRSKLGLHYTPAQRDAVAAWMQRRIQRTKRQLHAADTRSRHQEGRRADLALSRRASRRSPAR